MKKYAVLTANGNLAVGEVTSLRAKELVTKGVADWCKDRRAIKLSPQASRSARPTADLTSRFVQGRLLCNDPHAVLAVHAWNHVTRLNEQVFKEVEGWA